MTKENKLSLVYLKKISVPSSKTILEKECIVKKWYWQYADIIVDNIRYLIFEDKQGTGGYVLIGKKLDGGKFKNYFLAAFTEDQVKKLSGLDNVDKLAMTHALKSLIVKFKMDKNNFFKYIKKNYAVDYER